jgi:hypothetical protein
MDLNLIKENLHLKAFSLVRIPMILACNPKILELTRERVRVRLRLNWFTKNHWGTMYFGGLCVGADVAGGILVMKLVRESGQDVAMIFKDFQAQFLKRPDNDVEFLCEDGLLIEDLVRRTLNSTERQTLPVKIRAFVPKVSTTEAVAEFVLTVALKKKTL